MEKLSNKFILLLLHHFLISNVSGDRGSFVGCFFKNAYLRRIDLFSGSSNVCVDACKDLYYR